MGNSVNVGMALAGGVGVQVGGRVNGRGVCVGGKLLAMGLQADIPMITTNMPNEIFFCKR